MPTHFHFLIKITTTDIASLKHNIATLLSSYTNLLIVRLTDMEVYFNHIQSKKNWWWTIFAHTNVVYPSKSIASRIVKHIEDWNYSSYQDLIGLRSDNLVDQNFIQQYFSSSQEFKKYSEEIVTMIKYKYWI